MKKNYTRGGKLAVILGLFGLSGMAQLNGLYTINSGQGTGGTNYQTFSDFANDINTNGVSGPVTVNVVSGSGPYSEQVTFNQVSGTSASARVIINGNGNVLTWNATGSSSPWTLGLNGTDYFTVNDLNVAGTDNSYALVCKLSGGADYNTFFNCTFACNPNQTSSGQCPFSISSNMTSATAGGSASGNNNTVNTCTLSNGYYGFVSYGPTSGANTHDNTIINSRISDWYYYGVYFNYNFNFTMKNCEVDRITRTGSGTMYPVYGVYTNGSVIDGNLFHKFFDAQPGATGTMYWYMYYQSIALGDRNRWINNIITDIKHNGSIYMYMYNGGWDILHNTFDWDYAGGNHTGTMYPQFYTSSSSYGETNVYNNIFTLRKPGSGTRYAIYLSSASYLPFTNIDYNNIVTGTGTGNNYYGYIGTAYSSHAAWQAAGPDANGTALDPVYTSASDLHPTNVALNNKGTPKGIPVDQQMKGRSGTVPDVGALEFLSLPCSGTPNPGSVVSPAAAVCPGETANFILSGFSSDLGLTYQWSWSTTSSVGPFTVIPTATTVLYNTAPTFSTSWYQVVVTCANSNLSSTHVGTVEVAGTTTSVAPYYESFEGITRNNRLPNCSWSADDLGSNALTYTASNTLGRMSRTGSKFASFYYNPAGARSYYTNGIWLDAGVTYSASLWYITEYYGYNNWTDLSILVGPNQNATGQQTIASTMGPAVSNVYKPLSNTFKVTSSGLYYVAVRATAASGSAQYLSWDDLAIEIPCSLNSPTMTVSANVSTVCANDPAGVTITAYGAGSYSWSTGDQLSQVTVFPSIPGNMTYYVTGTHTLTNCKQTLPHTIVVNPAPDLNVFANPPVSCAGDQVSLYALGAQSYLWSTQGTGAIETVSPLNSEVFSVAGYNQYNCSSTATVQVIVNQLPVVTALHPAEICIGDVVMLSASGADTYTFMSASGLQLINPAPVSPQATTQYTVTGSDINGCRGVYLADISVRECVGLNEVSGANGIWVYPNPASSLLTVEVSSVASSQVVITDVTGRMVRSLEANGPSFNLDIQELANGVYYVIVQSQESSATIRIIKE